MDNKEAGELLDGELSGLRGDRYAVLLGRMTTGSVSYEVVGQSGRKYQVKIEVHWNDRRRRTIRVWGTIADGGWRQFVPLCRDFIKAPDDSFVGE